MTASPNQQTRAERVRAVLQAIRAAAAEGRPCPTNAELAGLAGVGTPRTARDMVRELEAAGHFRVIRFASWRIVTDLATGRSTAPKLSSTVPRPPPSYAGLLARGRTGDRPRANQARPSATSRDPCLRCGVPGFRGCKHQAPYEPSARERKLA
jgi:hypothetical protein